MFTGSRTKTRAAAVLASLALLATACGDDDSSAASDDTTVEGTTAPSGDGGTGGDATIGGAGIEAAPRDVAGLFEIDESVAIFAERPEGEDRTGVTDTEIIVGKHSPSSGPLASVTTAPYVQAYFDAINEAGGIHGRQLVLEDRDSAANPAQATQVVRELVEEVGIFAMFAGQITAAHLAVAPYLADAGVPDWAPNSSVPELAEPTEPTRFMALQASQLDALFAGEHMFGDEGASKVALIYQNDDFGTAWLEPLAQKAEEHGGEVVEISFELAASADLTSQVRQAAAENPDFIAVQSQYPQFAQIVTTLRESLGSDIPVFAAPAAAQAIPEGDELYDGVTSGLWFLTTADTGKSEVITSALATLGDAGVSSTSLAAYVLSQVESFVYALTLAGPDLTREGLLEAAEIGFDGSWTCTVCFAPWIYGPDDHWGLENARLATWSGAEGTWVYEDETRSFETSRGEGLRDLLPGMAAG